jgi:tetratricopeptide (TPR) repeat protein
MIRIKSPFAPILLTLFSLPLSDQEPTTWVGQKVVTKFKYPVKVGDRVVDDGSTFRIYAVTQTNGNWLWVVSESVEGWLPASQVVLFDQAIDFYTQEIRADPSKSAAYCKRGVIWATKKQFDAAIADYSEAIRLDPRYALAYRNRGGAWGGKKEYDKAIADYSAAIRLDPKCAWAYYNRAIAWNDKKNYDKAIADYSEASQLDPNDAEPYNSRAWLWATCPDSKLRNGKKAVESATRACELSEWKEANYLDTLAAAYAEAGDFDNAVECQEKADKLFTDAEVTKKAEERLKLYKDKKPYRATD